MDTATDTSVGALAAAEAAKAPKKPAREKVNGFVRPEPGSKTGIIWDFCDILYRLRGEAGEAHPVPLIAEVRELYRGAGGESDSSCYSQYLNWLDYHARKDEVKARRDAERPEVAGLTAEEIAAKKAEKEAKAKARAEKAEAKAAADKIAAEKRAEALANAESAAVALIAKLKAEADAPKPPKAPKAEKAPKAPKPPKAPKAPAAPAAPAAEAPAGDDALLLAAAAAAAAAEG